VSSALDSIRHFGIVRHMTVEGYSERSDPPRLTDAELVEGFCRNEVDGRAVMQRFLDKAGLAHAGALPLHRRDQQPFTDEQGNHLLIGDYMAVATQHPGATNFILGFVATADTDPDFGQMKEMATAMVGRYAPAATYSPQF
jgi:hypothetical protein